MTAALWPDVAGTFTLHRSDSHAFWAPGPGIVLLLEQDLGARKVAGWVRVTEAFLDDVIAGRAELYAFLAAELEPVFRPWAFPEPSWPALDLFPRLTRARAWIRDTAHRLAEARSIERPAR